MLSFKNESTTESWLRPRFGWRSQSGVSAGCDSIGGGSIRPEETNHGGGDSADVVALVRTLQSDLMHVRMRAKEQQYKHKMQMERLEEENAAYAIKVKVLEQELEKISCFTNDPISDDARTSNKLKEKDDKIKTLEERLRSLESENDDQRRTITSITEEVMSNIEEREWLESHNQEQEKEIAHLKEDLMRKSDVEERVAALQSQNDQQKREIIWLQTDNDELMNRMRLQNSGLSERDLQNFADENYKGQEPSISLRQSDSLAKERSSCGKTEPMYSLDTCGDDYSSITNSVSSNGSKKKEKASFWMRSPFESLSGEKEHVEERASSPAVPNNISSEVNKVGLWLTRSTRNGHFHL